MLHNLGDMLYGLNWCEYYDEANKLYPSNFCEFALTDDQVRCRKIGDDIMFEKNKDFFKYEVGFYLLHKNNRILLKITYRIFSKIKSRSYFFQPFSEEALF
jgi:hypothetical protein